MPSAAWITAAKKTPMEPVFYVACESVDAVNVTQNLKSDWDAGTLTNVETFDREGTIGGAGIRPKLFTYDNSQVNWTEWYIEPPKIGLHPFNPIINYMPYFSAPTAGYMELAAGRWRVKVISFKTAGDVPTVRGWSAEAFYPYEDPDDPGYLVTTLSAHAMSLLGLGLIAQGASTPRMLEGVSSDGYIFGSTVIADAHCPLYPVNDADFQYNFRAQTGTITTKVFDLGVVPNIPSRVLLDHMVTGAASIVYTAQGSTTGTGGWVDLGTVIDGGELAPYRYYRLTAVMTSTGYDTPEIYSIRVVGGNGQYVYFGDHIGEPALPLGEVAPYLHSVSSTSSKIALKEKPTVGDLTMVLAWMPLTSDLVQSTGKRRSVTVYLGFVGLAASDYEPYFTGVWDGYTADPDKRTFTVKLRDVWKKFKGKIPDQQNKDGATIPINRLFGQATDGTGTGTPLNIMDAIVQVSDLAKAPDRFIDKAAFASLKASDFSGPEWNVYRVLTEQKDSDELLKELSVTAGVFLVPAPNGKLTPMHYETAIAQTPAVTLDAAQIQFTGMTPDMADTVTRHNIYFNLSSDEQGRRLGGGSPADYRNVYTTVGSKASVIAERDREEVVVGEWFDNWGLAAGTAPGVPNPLTKLADRLASWFTPTATVGGKEVATTKTTVKATNVPLRYYADVRPGKMVYVDNLRLPCPLASWDGFSDNVKFMVMSWAVDPKNFTLTLDLFQISPLTYNDSPTWYAYDQWDLYPQASGLALTEQLTLGADGILTVSLLLSFVPPLDYRAGYYEVWVSDSGSDWALASTVPAISGRDLATATIPARSAADYQVAVVTVNTRGVRQPINAAPMISATVQGISSVETPADAGLAISGGDTVFTGRDCLLTWAASTLPSSLLGGYLVEVLSLADEVKRTVTISGVHFRYTYGMNLDDFGTPAPSFKIRVSTINTGGAVATPQIITVVNSTPAAPTALTATGRLMSIQLAASYTAPEDFDCLEIWSATSNDRSTVGGDPTAVIKNGDYVHTGLPPAAARYYWARVRDIYGQVSSWHPSSATGGVSGASISDPSEVIRLLNADVSAPNLDKYLTGAIPLLKLFDVGSGAFTAAAATPAAAATILQTLERASSGVLSQGDKIVEVVSAIAAQSVDLAGFSDTLDALNATVAGLITNDYDPLIAYEINAYVRYEGDVYRCIAATTAGILPTDSDYWELASSMLTLLADVQQEVDYLNGEILNKVAVTTYDTAIGALELADSSMSQRADLIDSKVKTTTLSILGGEIFDPTRRYVTNDVVMSADLQYRCILDIPDPPLGYAPAADVTHWLNVPISGRMVVAESGIAQAADAITLHAETIVGPLAFSSAAALPSASIFGMEDLPPLNARLSRVAIDLDSASANITLQASRVDTLTGRVSAAEISLDGANAAISLRATKNELSGEVVVLSDMIGLKLNSTGTVGPGIAIGWTDYTQSRSNITMLTDTFRIAKPDGTGSKNVFTVGEIEGVSTVGISGDMVIDGTLLARHIAADQLIVGDNVTMGPDAYIAWTNVSSRPTTLAGLDSTASTKLAGIAAGATLGADWNTNVSNKPTIPTVPAYITSTKITQTTIESPTIMAGTLTGAVIQTTTDPGVGDRTRLVITGADNKLEFFNASNERMVFIGTGATHLGVPLFGRFGSLTAGNSAVGLEARSYSNVGLSGESIEAPGVFAQSVDDYGIEAMSGSKYGVYGGGKLAGVFGRALRDGVNYGYGAVFQGTEYDYPMGVEHRDKAPILLMPGKYPAAPTHSADIGALWPTSTGILYICIGGTSWQKVGAQ